MNRSVKLRLPLLSMLIAFGSTSLSANSEVKLLETWKNIEFHIPILIASPPDDTGRLFLVDLDGHIYILPKDRDSTHAELFLDISDRTLTERTQRFTEEGLLGLAFHPEFATNGRFYVNYTLQDPKRSIVSEFSVSPDDPDKANQESERTLISLRQPYWNHNSGNLFFGPSDGFLYIAFGDGGLRNDPLRFGQNLFSMNGKILRIDVDTQSDGLEYGIPKDNPFVDQPGILPEVWAYGLRNPWGIWIDDLTDVFWCADVGQDLWEEINIIEKGGNYGWNLFEGPQRFGERYNEPLPDGATFIEPLFAYGREKGFSISGGYVYRGSDFPELTGCYIYGDFVAGRIWALKSSADMTEVISNTLVYEKPNPFSKEGFRPNAFCPDSRGEILIPSWDGKIYQLSRK
ncbi:MAG: PQQ-dependent sugar dehydrogenase [Verrucomicrobiota bacterium]